jgi:tRNA1Val (adenine37-N6)-methyltransferase
MDRPSSIFRFTPFSVEQVEGVMKVGTDSVLLGAWVDLTVSQKTLNILDVGAGTGILSLFCASRCVKSHVLAIDIDEASVNLCDRNVSQSDYRNRIETRHIDLIGLGRETKFRHFFDLVISNPPFFNKTYLPIDENRQRIRHTSNLSHEVLIYATYDLLRSGGRLAIILPVTEIDDVIKNGEKVGFELTRQAMVYPKPYAEANRVMLEWTKEGKGLESKFTTNRIVVRKDDGSYHEDYKSLAGSFHDRPI